jgi:hypothetical protein
MPPIHAANSDRAALADRGRMRGAGGEIRKPGASACATRRARRGVLRESKRHHNRLDADRLFHVKIAEAGADRAPPPVVVQTFPAWEQCARVTSEIQ